MQKGALAHAHEEPLLKDKAKQLLATDDFTKNLVAFGKNAEGKHLLEELRAFARDEGLKMGESSMKTYFESENLAAQLGNFNVRPQKGKELKSQEFFLPSPPLPSSVPPRSFESEAIYMHIARMVIVLLPPPPPPPPTHHPHPFFSHGNSLTAPPHPHTHTR
jgi:hypothetical protein